MLIGRSNPPGVSCPHRLKRHHLSLTMLINLREGFFQGENIAKQRWILILAEEESE
jgi:hypothetical protein